jgi:hypothetical protein
MNPHISHTLRKGAARCPRFDSCNAPICPLDNWQRAQHLEGEAVCGLLSELVKDGGEARLRACMPSALVDTLANALPKITAQWWAIRWQLQRASRTGSKLEAMQHVRRLKKAARADDANRPATVAPVRTSLPATTPLNGGSSAIGGTDGRR